MRTQMHLGCWLVRFQPWMLIWMALGVGLGLDQAVAQVSVAISIDQSQYLRNESLPVRVRITNLSGRNLRIGETSDWLTFTMESKEGRTVTPVGMVKAGGNFDLESAASVTKLIDLGEAYDLGEAGRFKVTAVARFPALSLEVPSNQVLFDVVHGTRLWEQTCGVPGAKPEDAPIWIKYALLQTTELKNIKLFARISDDLDAKYARVVFLGRVVSFSNPDKAIDRRSMLHVLFQAGARSMEYQVISPHGDVVTKQTYEFVGTRPRLTSSEDGVVMVKGGQLKKAPVRPLPDGSASAPSTNASSAGTQSQSSTP